MWKKSRIDWDKNDPDDSDFEDIILVFAKQIYGFICEDDNYNERSKEDKEISADAFQQMIEKLLCTEYVQNKKDDS